eukprot:SAG11_NODE_2567_length_3215_cov_2.528562_4_plen_359_part_00
MTALTVAQRRMRGDRHLVRIEGCGVLALTGARGAAGWVVLDCGTATVHTLLGGGSGGMALELRAGLSVLELYDEAARLLRESSGRADVAAERVLLSLEGGERVLELGADIVAALRMASSEGVRQGTELVSQRHSRSCTRIVSHGADPGWGERGPLLAEVQHDGTAIFFYHPIFIASGDQTGCVKRFPSSNEFELFESIRRRKQCNIWDSNKCRSHWCEQNPRGLPQLFQMLTVLADDPARRRAFEAARRALKVALKAMLSFCLSRCVFPPRGAKAAPSICSTDELYLRFSHRIRSVAPNLVCRRARRRNSASSPRIRPRSPPPPPPPPPPPRGAPPGTSACLVLACPVLKVEGWSGQL